MADTSHPVLTLARAAQPPRPLPLLLSVLPSAPNLAHGSSLLTSATEMGRVGWSTGTGVGAIVERGPGEARDEVLADAIGSSGAKERGARPERVAPLLSPEKGAGCGRA